jgi:HEAT repeat protein
VRGTGRWSPRVWQYRVEQAHLTRFEAEGATPGETRGRVAGTWSVGTDDACVVNDGRVVLAVRLTPTVWDTEAWAEQGDKLAEEASRPFAVDVDAATGRIVGFRFDPAVGPVARTILRSLASTMQLSVPGGDAAGGLPGSWTTDEDDTGGRYAARYVAVGSPAASVRRTRVYTQAQEQTSGAQGVPVPLEVEGMTQFGLDATLWPVRITSNETLLRKGAMAILSVRSEVRLTAERTGDAPPGPDVAATCAAAARWRSLGTTDDEALASLASAGERTADLRTLAGRGVAELLAELRALKPGPDVDARQRVALGLTALLRSNPAAAVDLAAAVTVDDPDWQVAMIAQALSVTDTPEALQALTGLLGNPKLLVAQRTQAAAALASAVRGSTEAVDALWQARDEGVAARDAGLASSATLAIGTQTGRIPDAAARAEQLTRLRAAHAAATTEDDRAAMLGALGNTGDADLFDVIAPALADRSPMVRASAVYALRSSRDPRADEAIAAALLADGAEPVRVAALRTIAVRVPLRHAGPLGQALTADPASAVRGEVLQLAEASTDLAEALRLPIRRCAAEDASERLRARAQSLLQPAAAAPTTRP